MNLETELANQPIEHHYEALPGFSAISKLEKAGVFVDMIGIVISFGEIKPTRGPDMQRSMIMCDPTATMPSSGLLIQFYRPDGADLPRPVVGSILILKSFKLFDHRSSLQAWSHNSSGWVVYDANGQNVLNQSSGNHFTISPLVETFVRRLASWWKTRSGMSGTTEIALPANVNSATAHTGARSTQLIRDVRENMFFDVYGHVVKTYPTRDNAFTLYITDYTTNTDLHDYKYGESKWQGPWGQQTMQITLWDGHGHFARANVHEGTYVSLTNVHGKRNNSGRLEGALRGDRYNPDRINVKPIKAEDPLVKPIRLRKKQYETNWALEKERLEEAIVQIIQSEKLLAMTPPTAINSNIETSYNQVPNTPIGDILEPPFMPHAQRQEGPGVRKQPKKYRTVGRVVDFWPSDLRDFARPYCMACQATYCPADPELKASDHSQPIDEICTICGVTRDADDPITYEFAFALLVEGQDGVALPLIFSGDDLETLFDDDDLRPCNLYLPENQIMLSRLREKMFLVWGDLEERFETPVRSKKRKFSEKQERESTVLWTEFCIMEYWVNEHGGQAGWQGRRFRAFGMRII